MVSKKNLDLCLLPRESIFINYVTHGDGSDPLKKIK